MSESEPQTPKKSGAQPLSVKQWDWLNEESKHWVNAGLISTEQLRQIKAQYSPSTATSWVVYLLSAMGAIVFGLGIILLFAYNWSELTKAAKICIIVGALLLTHGIAFVLRINGSTHSNLIEGFHLLGTMMFGAGIWLIAQIYHIDEHYPTAFALWGAGTLLLAWALPSVLQGLIASVLLMIWGIAEVTDFNKTHYFSLLALALCVLPLAWQLRSRVLLFKGIAGFLFLGFINLQFLSYDEAIPYLLFAVSAMLITVSYFAEFSVFPRSRSIVRFFGLLLYGCTLFTASVQGFPRSFYREPLEGTLYYIVIGAILLALVPLFSSIYYHSIGNTSKNRLIEKLLVCASLVACLLVAFSIFSERLFLAILIFNVILAAHCILFIMSGVDDLRWQNVAIGGLTLSALVVWQFNDLFQSLLMRAAAFLVLGAVLFLIGHVFAKSKQRSDDTCAV